MDSAGSTTAPLAAPASHSRKGSYTTRTTSRRGDQTPLKIESFLHYGYDVTSGPRPPALLREIERLDDDCPTYEEARGAWVSVFQNSGADHHVVPLSGGWDSRAILAGLLRAGEKDRITTVSFGTPGSLDYEIARRVARQAGVRHVGIDLLKIPVTQQDLMEVAQQTAGSWTYLLQAFYNRLIYSRFDSDATYWNGFFAGSLMGAAAGKKHLSWDEAKALFATRNRFNSDVPLLPNGHDPEGLLPHQPWLDPDKVSYYEQLHVGLRQERCIKPILLTEDHDIRLPFLAPGFKALMARVPEETRMGKRFYMGFLRSLHPELFKIPTKKEYAVRAVSTPERRFLAAWDRTCHWGNRRLPWLPLPWARKENYVDVGRLMRSDPTFRSLVHHNLEDLKGRRIVAPRLIQRLQNEQRFRLKNHSKAIIQLVSLEMYLKTVEENRDWSRSGSAAR
jgi:hypothetical protein